LRKHNRCLIGQRLDKDRETVDSDFYAKTVAEANRIAHYQKDRSNNCYIDITHLSDEQLEHFVSEMERLDTLDDLHLSTWNDLDDKEIHDWIKEDVKTIMKALSE
jgi:hypothetical protein